MNKPVKMAAIVAACIAIPLAVNMAKGKSATPAEITHAEMRKIRPMILATGTLTFSHEAQLSSEVIGRVVEILVKEGEQVRQGQLLLKLDRTSYEATVAQQLANVRSAEIALERTALNVRIQRSNLDRATKLAASNFIGASKAEQAEHDYGLAVVDQRVAHESVNHARAALSEARERLAKTEIRSPIDGTVTAIPIKVGETAVVSATSIAGSSLMTIANVKTLRAEINVDEADVARVALGAIVKVFPSTQAGAALEGEVESIALVPKSNNGARNYVVKVRLPGADLGVRAGMTCRAEVSVGEAMPALSLPIQAVLSEKKRGSESSSSYVYAVESGVAIKREVETGNADDHFVEIRKGLAATDNIAIGPVRILHDLHGGERLVPTDTQPLDKKVLN